MTRTYSNYTDGSSALALDDYQPVRRFDYDFDSFYRELDEYRHPIDSMRYQARRIKTGTCMGLAAKHHTFKDKVLIGFAFGAFLAFMIAEATLLAL